MIRQYILPFFFLSATLFSNSYECSAETSDAPARYLDSETLEDTEPPVITDETSGIEADSPRLETGVFDIPEDLNWSDPNQVQSALLKDKDFSALGSASITEVFLSGDEEVDAEADDTQASYKENYNSLPQKTDDLSSKYDSSMLRGAVAAKMVIEELKAQKLKSEGIQCYISKNIEPSYICPNDPSIRFGGGGRTDNEYNLRKCNEICMEEFECLDLKVTDINSPTFVSLSTDLQSQGATYGWPVEYEIATEPGMKIDRVEPVFTIDETLSESAYSRFDLAYQMRDEQWQPLATNLKIKFSNPGDMYVSTATSKLHIKIFKPEVPAADVNKSIAISGVKIHYTGTRHWFCPTTHIIADDEINLCAQMGGVIEVQYTDGGRAINICRSAALDGDDDGSGGYYSKDSCEKECRIKEACIASYAYANVSASTIGIDVGCVDTSSSDGASNVNCTPDLCKELIASDNYQPTEEKVLMNVGGTYLFKDTVTGGAPVGRYIRPRVDLEANFQAELEGGDYTQAQINEKKDSAYLYMLNHQRYTNLSTPMGEATPPESAVEITASASGMGSAVWWLLKPSSADIGNNKEYYLYAVAEVGSDIRAVAGSWPNVNECEKQAGTNNYPEWINPYTTEDCEVLLQDKTWMIKSSSGAWQVFRKINNAFIRDSGGITTPLTSAYDMDFVKYDSGAFVQMAENEPAPYMAGMIFDGKPFERIKIASSIEEEIDSTPGVIPVRQEAGSGGARLVRIYAGESDNSKGWLTYYRIHAIYAPRQLSYDEIYSALTAYEASEVPPYSIYALGSKSIYPTKIRGDGTYGENTRLFLQGTVSNTRVIGLFEPDPQELGQDAFYYLMLIEPKEE